MMKLMLVSFLILSVSPSWAQGQQGGAQAQSCTEFCDKIKADAAQTLGGACESRVTDSPPDNSIHRIGLYEYMAFASKKCQEQREQMMRQNPQARMNNQSGEGAWSSCQTVSSVVYCKNSGGGKQQEIMVPNMRCAYTTQNKQVSEECKKDFLEEEHKLCMNKKCHSIQPKGGAPFQPGQNPLESEPVPEPPTRAGR